METRPDSNMSDRQLMEIIWEKVTDMGNNLKSFVKRIDNVEKKVTELQNRMEDIDQGVSFIETEFQEQKDKIAKVKEESISKKELELIKKEIIGLSNISRRNNVVLHSIPEGVENDLGCQNYVL